MGVSVHGGLCPWGSLSMGVSVWGLCPVLSVREQNRMTDKCKNITLPQTLFAGGNKFNYITT